MATRTPTRRGASGRKRVSRPKKQAPRATRGRTKAPKRRSLGSRFSAFRESVRHHLGRQTDDVWGMVLVVLSVLATLAFFGQAGPAGRWTIAALELLFGLWSYAVPVALAGMGLLLITDGRKSPSGRIATGVALAFVGTLSLFHLMTGTVSLSASIDLVKDRGGAVGSLIAFPLRRVIGFWGAFVVLVAFTGAGLLILSKSTVRQMWLAVVEIVKGMRMWARSVPPRKRVVVAARPAKPQPKHRAVSQQPPAKPSRPPTRAKPKPGPGQTSLPLSPPVPGEGYRTPPIELLSIGTGEAHSRRALEETARELEDTLVQHGVDAHLTKIVPGPTVTRYEIELAPGVKVARVTSLSHDIAYALATPDVRLLAPIPGKSAIGVEVPNRRRRLITLGDVLRSTEAQEDADPLTVGLGLDISGNPKLLHLEELPHVLIAGATGAGKSSCINSMVTSLLMRTSPDNVRLIMVDPKRVELGQYNGVPHLLTRVITNPKKAADALQWVVSEMDRRYDLVADAQVRDIIGYREKWDADLLDRNAFDRFPYIVVVVDELNDLMMVAGRQVEAAIVRIAQMARAVGIHLVIATQRPSVDVITGVIKANIPSRLAFSVASMADSRVILDTGGAEKLVGMGDMLVATATHPRPERIQGAWVSEDEIHSVVNWVKRQQEARYQDKVIEAAAKRQQDQVDEDEGEDAELLREAMELIVRSQLGSTSMLQRKLRVGFARAGRLMDILERQGVVGPSEGSKARAVLMTVEELESLLAGTTR
jgi:S-DNA-T family DNA segregation ATPase FtsK/SpoIIIE